MQNGEPQRMSPEQAEALRQKAIKLRDDNPITNARIREYHGLVDRIVTGFDPEKLRIESAVFPEKLFRACGFMDFFFGFVKDTPELDLENKWIAIAGSPSSEVSVIDEGGNVLFIVPPLYDTSYLRIGNYRRDDMLNEITQNYENHAQASRHQADGYLGVALTAKLQNIVSNESTQVDKHAAMLEKMYAYYGKRPANAGAAPAATAAAANTKIHDDFEID